MKSGLEQKEVICYSGRKRKKSLDFLAREKEVSIYLNEKRISRLYCTPSDIKQLAAGFLFSEGWIENRGDLVSIKSRNGSVWAKVSRLSPGLNFELRKIRASLSIPSQAVYRIMENFSRISKLFKRSGAVHTAALSDGKKIILYKDDISRHNALDKLCGECWLRGIDLKDKLLFTSGRVPQEVAMKALRWQVPILVSVSAVTAEAASLAQKWQATLIGFCRGRKMNIYSCPERII